MSIVLTQGIALSVIYYLWTTENRNAQISTLTFALRNSIYPACRTVVDSMKIPYYSGGLSHKRKAGFWVTREDYNAYIKHTTAYPQKEAYETLVEEQIYFRLNDQTLDLNVLAGIMIDSLKQAGLEMPAIGFKLWQNPGSYLRDTVHASIDFYPAEKKDSIIASYCYQDSIKGFDYQQANVISDTLRIGIRNEGKLVAYMIAPYYKAANTFMQKQLKGELTSTFLYTILALFVFFLIIYIYRRKPEVITHTIVETKSVYIANGSHLPPREELVYECMGVRLYPKGNTLKNDTAVVENVQGIPFKILELLFQSPEHYVDKKELKTAIWPDEEISEKTLNERLATHISFCRGHLEKFHLNIENERRKGYFIKGS